MSPGHPALPPRVSRPWLASAAMVWVLATVLSGDPVAHEIPEGPYHGEITVVGEVVEGPYGPWVMAEIEQGLVLVDLEEPVPVGRGDTVVVEGRMTSEAGWAGGKAYGAILERAQISAVERSRFWPHVMGRAIRGAVTSRLSPMDPGRALLAGFLIGATDDIPEADVDAMRRSGLAHFVAVSGSNVALMLGLIAVVTGPLATGPRRRALLGLAALPAYAAATGFEPSVLRASVMAGLALGGRLFGIVFETWQLISLAVVVLLISDPGLARSVGFQLSVAATCGVLVGSRWPLQGRVRRALAVSAGAQTAVAPLIIAHFDTVPLLSPLVNLVAAPVVAAATVTGALGVALIPWLITPAAWLSGLVLVLSRGAAGWPQLSIFRLVAVLIPVLLFVVFPRFRAPGVVAGCLVVVLTVLGGGSDLPGVGVVVLDVGQGDAILIHGGPGRFALVDGGPDPVTLLRKLREFGVGSIELVVLTHAHADHAAGLTDLPGSMPIGQIWADTEPHSTSVSDELLEAAAAHGVSVVEPGVGTVYQLGALTMQVEGPLRHYASPNDQSIVLIVEGPGRSILLSGDVETHAQTDLSDVRADVLKVPHHGAATSDPSWLEEVGATEAVISVGPNDFGHPVQWVIDLMERSGSVHRTDLEGDVIVDLSR